MAASATKYMGFFNLRATAHPVDPSVRTDSTGGSSSSSSGCRKLDGVGMWIVNGIASAFFASLERCSCIRISTYEDGGDEANDDLPLIYYNRNYRLNGGATSRRRTGVGKIGDQAATNNIHYED